ncbi:MAG: helix-turn-helix transcriptional regulator [Oscillospiraceae bacterium]|nr:helix-turn-helix transcriptional regulator [Oscillospiraceae bacterium]
MDKKTIGAFLAALRKAKGLTQKQLAEKLNVSDKAVSRWERDECAPDLSLIPVLAEIYGVTADEILRGQRLDPENSAQAPDNYRTEKQLKRIIASAQTKFRIRSIVSITIALLGIFAAAICNHGFNQAAIGYMIGCVFFVSAAICQIIFLILGLSAINTDELDTGTVSSFRKSMIQITELVISVILVFLVGAMPLIILTEGFPYIGINAGWVFDTSLPYSLLTAVICIIISLLINKPNKGKPFFNVSASSRKLLIRCGALLLIYLAVVFIAQYCVNVFFLSRYHLYTPCNQFDTIEAFQKYIETPTDPLGNPMKLIDASKETYEDGTSQTFLHYTAEDGTEYVLSDKENIAYLYYTYTDDGFTYYSVPVHTEESFFHSNLSIAHIEVSNESDIVPIYTFTHEQLRQGAFIETSINIGFVILYLCGIVAAILFFIKKRNK